MAIVLEMASVANSQKITRNNSNIIYKVYKNKEEKEELPQLKNYYTHQIKFNELEQNKFWMSKLAISLLMLISTL